MLIKDPYLESHKKQTENRHASYLPQHNTSTQSQPARPHPDLIRNRAVSSGEVNELQGRVKAYERELKNMEQAYVRQEEAARKMLSYNEVNREYHEAIRARNFDLNTKLRDVVGEMQLVQYRSSEEIVRNNHDKDLLLKKYEQQTEEYLRLRANYNALLEQKTRLEEQVTHLSFLLQKEAHQYELQSKEQALRMESLDRTYKALVAAKEEQILQLTHRLRNYQDENRKLVDINKTLQLTKDRPDRLDNISQINHLESNIKSRTHHKDKQNQDANIPASHVKENNELKEQRTINDELRREIDNLKKELKGIHLKNNQIEQQREEGDRGRVKADSNLLETSKWQGLMASISSLREGLNKEIFEIFFKSIKDGQRRKQNSLVIFIQNWRSLDFQRLHPYIKSYYEARQNLKQVADSKPARQSVHYPKMEELIPLQVGSRPNRSNINQWILSTIQFTKNQRQSGKKNFNNCLLFLFRLLTIEYRIKYPMQGKSYHLDQDVVNELQHEIIKAIQAIFQYN